MTSSESSDAITRASTLGQLLAARVATSPVAEALRFGDRSMTYRELELEARRMAGTLRRWGVEPGDRIALLLDNGLDAPVAWFAAAALEAVVVPIDTRLGARDLAWVLNHSGASVVVVGAGRRAQVHSVRTSVPGVRSVLERSDEAPGPWTRAALNDGFGPEMDSTASIGPEDADPQAPVAIQYTSGTTGFPKGCVLHHGYWLRLARTIQSLSGVTSRDVLITAQPQSYMDPTWNLVLGVLAGAPLVILPRFSASTFWADVSRAGATFFYCIGTMPLYLLKQPENPELDRGHDVRLVYCSGIPAVHHAEMERRWGCLWRETYGSTELGVVLAAHPEDEHTVGSGSMGRPVSGRDVAVEVQSDTPSGELLVRGPDTMLRYHEDESATESWTQQGWARTGDIVRKVDEGYALVGRTKDMIRRGGENISAAEVESVLNEHVGVRAAACIPVPDELRGEEVKAYVLPVAGVALSEAEIHAFVAARLARFKVPRYVEVVTDFPITQSGKIAKGDLRASRADHVTGAWDASQRSVGDAPELGRVADQGSNRDGTWI